MAPVREIHVLNLGAGVQSTTLYLMFAYGELPITLDAAVFADTGEEPRAVYEHLAWLQSLGGPPIIVRSVGSRLGDDLVHGRNSTGQRFAAIPAFTRFPREGDDEDEIGRTKRQCSKEYKVEVIERTIRRDVLGLAPQRRVPKGTTVHQYVGISIDEAGRFTRLQARRTLGQMHAPLIERHMTRENCVRWLTERGNVPHEVRRSACVFCPFHDDAEWLRVKAVPEDWARAVEVDEGLRTTGAVANRNTDAALYVHRTCQPLVQIDFRPKQESRQEGFQFWREDPFSRECLGVCGL